MSGFHGSGLPMMEQIAITSQYDVNTRKNIVRNLAGVAPAKKVNKKQGRK